MKRNLTDSFLRTVTTKGAAQVDFFDAQYPGLAMRVSKDGRKAWNFCFTSPTDAKRARMTFSTYPVTGLEDARLKSLELRKLVEAGKDPRVEEARPTEKTIRQLMDARLADARRQGMRSVDEVERLLTQNVIPVIGDMPIREFRRRHLNQIVDPMIARGAEVSANRVVQQVKALFNFALEKDEVEFNPLARAKMPTKETARDRFLSLAEIRKVWLDADCVLARSEGGGRPNCLHTPIVLRLCLATGQRLSEICGMKRGEIDVEKRVWTIPAERVKNGDRHAVPLNDLAMSLIGERMRQTNADILFPRDTNADMPIEHRLVDRAVKRVHDDKAEGAKHGRWNMPEWTPHDLRRTVASQMSIKENAMEISDLHISLVLNHRSATSGSITHRVYIQNDYLDEKRDALDKWGTFLAKLVGWEIEEREAA